MVFRDYFKMKREDRKRVDKHKLVSMAKTTGTTFDFIFDTTNDAISFIIAVSEHAAKQNPNFFKISNRSLLSKVMLKKWFEALAHQQSLTMPQMFLFAIYQTIFDLFPQETPEEKSRKLAAAEKIMRISRNFFSSEYLDKDLYEHLKL